MNLNKKIIIILVVLIIVFTTIISVSNRTKENPAQFDGENNISLNLERCFIYEREATDEEPYSVKEDLKIVFNNGIVSGVKTGFQSGPDMTNGYSGSIDGFVKSDMIEALFTYTVEGYQGAERELYRLLDDSLVKMRYQLIEGENGLLIPDMSSIARGQVYKEVGCF